VVLLAQPPHTHTNDTIVWPWIKHRDYWHSSACDGPM